MKTSTILARVPIGYNDIGTIGLNETGIELLDQMLSNALPEDVVICGDEVIGPADSDFCQEDFDGIIDAVCESILNIDRIDIWED